MLLKPLSAEILNEENCVIKHNRQFCIFTQLVRLIEIFCINGYFLLTGLDLFFLPQFMHVIGLREATD